MGSKQDKTMVTKIKQETKKKQKTKTQKRGVTEGGYS